MLSGWKIKSANVRHVRQDTLRVSEIKPPPLEVVFFRQQRPEKFDQVRGKKMEAKNKQFKLIGETNEWWLFDREKDQGNWKNLKLVLKDKKHKKRNFWFGWDTKQKRMTKTNDTKILKNHYTEFYDQVLEKLTPPVLKIVG